MSFFLDQSSLSLVFNDPEFMAMSKHFPEEEMKSRRSQVSVKFNNLGLDGILLFKQESISI